MDSKAMASESPPTTRSPKTKGDAEVLSRRTFPGRGEVQEAPEGETPITGHQGSRSPWRLVMRVVFSSALSRTQFRRPMRLRNLARNLLRKKEDAYSAGDPCPTKGTG